MATLNFNAADVDTSNTFEPIPAGEYEMMVVESEMKTTKRGDGQYLELVIQLLDEEYAGRRIWERLNLVNPNEKAVAIAQRQLAELCAAIGVLSLEDSIELHDIPFRAKVKVEPARGDFGPSNSIAKYIAV